MFNTPRLQALEPKTEAVALPIQHLDAIASFIEENEQYGVEHGDLDIQLDQRGEAVDGLSEVYGLGIEVHLFDFAVGSHHGGRAPERNRERSIGHQVDAWNVGMMDPLHLNGSNWICGI